MYSYIYAEFLGVLIYISQFLKKKKKKKNFSYQKRPFLLKKGKPSLNLQFPPSPLSTSTTKLLMSLTLKSPPPTPPHSHGPHLSKLQLGTYFSGQSLGITFHSSFSHSAHPLLRKSCWFLPSKERKTGPRCPLCHLHSVRSVHCGTVHS